MYEITRHNTPMRVVLYAAQTSRDPSTQNAAVLVDKDGHVINATVAVNEFPKGVVQHPSRWDRAVKYNYVEHAERNSIYAAARQGISTEGLIMYAVWASCSDCARAIIQAGITTLVRYAHSESHWRESINHADVMLAEAGIKVITLTHPISNVQPILWQGREWLPEGNPATI